jgi:hypothetical protein
MREKFKPLKDVVQLWYGKFIGRAKLIRIIGDPDKKRPDKRRHTLLYTCTQSVFCVVETQTHTYIYRVIHKSLWNF